jgi:xanthine dehydrogenase YagT iron-sulfur-binding subunit
MSEDWTRREVLEKGVTLGGLSLLGGPSLATTIPAEWLPEEPASITATLHVNGEQHVIELDPRATLVDTLREQLGLTGTKKGCDRGECGACTVHIGGQQVLACMTLAIMTEGREITTIEGLAKHGELHAVQSAFIEHDAFQCGFCTSGQIMSAVACIRDGHAETDEQIAEYMSGNLCRCAAYPQIRAAVRAAARRVD